MIWKEFGVISDKGLNTSEIIFVVYSNVIFT